MRKGATRRHAERALRIILYHALRQPHKSLANVVAAGIVAVAVAVAVAMAAPAILEAAQQSARHCFR